MWWCSIIKMYKCRFITISYHVRSISCWETTRWWLFRNGLGPFPRGFAAQVGASETNFGFSGFSVGVGSEAGILLRPPGGDAQRLPLAAWNTWKAWGMLEGAMSPKAGVKPASGTRNGTTWAMLWIQQKWAWTKSQAKQVLPNDVPRCSCSRQALPNLAMFNVQRFNPFYALIEAQQLMQLWCHLKYLKTYCNFLLICAAIWR